MSSELQTDMAVDSEVMEAFVTGVRGTVLRPDDEAYDGARTIWNGLIDRRPALIVQCTGAADVVDAVNFARDENVLLSIKAGGHNVAGNAVNDGGLVIDFPRCAVSASTRRRRRCVQKAARLGARPTGRRSSSGSPYRAAWSRPRASPALRFTAASVICAASTDCRSTT